MTQIAKKRIEPFMDQFYQDILRTVPNLDPYLAMKIMRLNKELQYRPPHVHLTVEYKKGINLNYKQEKARDDFPLQVAESRWHDCVIITGMMDVETVQKICADPDIVRITGDANAAMY